MRHSRRLPAAIAAVGAIGLSQLGAAAAMADDRPIVFTDPTTVELEYGQYWSFDLLAQDDPGPYYADTVVLSGAGIPSGYTPYYYGSIGAGMSTIAHITVSDTLRPLNAGTYQITATISDDYPYDDGSYTWTTTSPATLKINPAKIGAELRVVADPSNGENAIVTARFTGRFVDDYYSSTFDTAPLSPAGVWKITLADADGTVVTERSIERTAGDDVLATSFYFTDGEPGEQYTATAAFTPSGTSATNFSMTQPADFAYTAADVQRPTPTSTATAAAVEPPAPSSDFALPLWALIAAGVLGAGLIALVAVFAVRTVRSQPIAPEVAS